MPGVTIAVGCLRGEPEIRAATERAPKPSVVVPLLMSEGYIFKRLRERLAGLFGALLTAPVGTHPGLAAIVGAAAVRAAQSRGWQPRMTTLLLVGHGTPRHSGNGLAAKKLARRLQQAGAFAAVDIAFLEQFPFLPDRLAARGNEPVVALGLFVDAGPHGKDDVEAAIGNAPGPVVYAGPVGRLAGIRRLIVERAGLGS